MRITRALYMIIIPAAVMLLCGSCDRDFEDYNLAREVAGNYAVTYIGYVDGVEAARGDAMLLLRPTDDDELYLELTAGKNTEDIVLRMGDVDVSGSVGTVMATASGYGMFRNIFSDATGPVTPQRTLVSLNATFISKHFNPLYTKDGDVKAESTLTKNSPSIRGYTFDMTANMTVPGSPGVSVVRMEITNRTDL